MDFERQGTAMRRVLSIFLFGALLLTGCAQADDETTALVEQIPPTATIQPSPTAVYAVDELTITIVYDNTTDNPDLMVEWGFAALIDVDGQRILFDTGLDGPSLMNNLAVLGIDPLSIEMVVISHAHEDHTGGLQTFLAANPEIDVYVPTSAEILAAAEEAQVRVIPVDDPREILPGVYSTGTMDGGIPEQGLVISTDEGSVVITGCAHPGIVNIVHRAMDILPMEPALVMGGFHLGGYGSGTLRAIIDEFRAMGVRQVTPTHCTGDDAIAAFAEAYGADYLPGGAGAVFTFGER